MVSDFKNIIMPGTAFYKIVEEHVTALFNQHQPPKLVLHTLQHTQVVVQRANEIAGQYKLSEDDMLVIFIAAWFHDTGYLFGPHTGHEQRGAELMEKFLQEHDAGDNIISAVRGCILATKCPRDPHNLVEEIVCDADTFQFGDKEIFKKTNKLAFEELKHIKGEGFERKAFDEGTIDMLEDHKFFTSYARELLKDGKKDIMKKIKKRIKDDKYDEADSGEITEKDGTTKGMQTMLRLTSSNHIQLSEMADSKANILISVNAIIISVILSVLLRKLQTDPYLTIPTILFLAFSVTTIVVAILATRPKLNTGTFADEDIVNKKTNLLFFGNFHRMTHDQYEGAMRTMMKDSDYLYSSIIQDIFHLGQVLGKKYKLIRLAYNIFMMGIVISVIAFSVAALLHTTPPEGVITNNNGSPF